MLDFRELEAHVAASNDFVGLHSSPLISVGRRDEMTGMGDGGQVNRMADQLKTGCDFLLSTFDKTNSTDTGIVYQVTSYAHLMHENF